MEGKRGNPIVTAHMQTPQQDPTDIDPSEPVRLYRDRRPVWRFIGLGSELAGFTLVSAGVGHLLDNGLQNPKPYATALAALAGFTIGMIRFIYQVRK